MNAPFPEIKSSMDPKDVPWHMAVVWSDRAVNGQRVYEWLTKENIRLVNWSNGLLSLQIDDRSPIGRDVMYLVINAPFIAIGKNLPV